MAPGLIVNKSVTAEHLATLHFLHTRILPLYSAFLYLEQTISMLRKIKVAVGQPNAPDNVTIKPQEQFGDVSATMHSYKTNASALLKRWTVTVDMVNTALNLTDQKLAREQNGLVTALGKFTASDSASIHVITIITLVFLCFTVVSVGSLSHNSTVRWMLTAAGRTGCAGYAVLLSRRRKQPSDCCAAVDLSRSVCAVDTGVCWVLALAGVEEKRRSG